MRVGSSIILVGHTTEYENPMNPAIDRFSLVLLFR